MEYYELGTYTRQVTTTSDDAQRWFDRGLAWTYAYNHEEAILCFQNAVAAVTNQLAGVKGVRYDLLKYNWIGRITTDNRVLAMRKDAPNLKRRLDLFIEESEQTGFLRSLYNKYFENDK